MELRRGFTLIELLVVIAIIALLMAVLLPALDVVKERSREIVCRSHLRNVGLAILMYVSDNGITAKIGSETSSDSDRTNRFFWYDNAGNMMSKTEYDAYWGVVYYDYVKDTRPWGCPSYKHVANLIYDVPPALIHEAAFCFNAFLNKRQVDKARNHAEIIVCHDHVEPRIEQGSIDMFHNDDGSAQWNLRHFRPGGNNNRMPLYPGIFRHAIKTNPVITNTSDPTEFETGGRANILWLDGHVSGIEETQGGFGKKGKDVPSRWYTAGGLWTSRFRN